MLVFRYINHTMKCFNNFYACVKLIGKNAETIMECTYKSSSIMDSNGHKELKMVQNDIQDNCLFVYVQIN